MEKRLFVQVDGVLADFNSAARELLRRMFPKAEDGDDGAWPKAELDLTPYTEDQWREFARMAIGMPSWWLRVPPLRENVAEWYSFLTFGLGMVYNVYYISVRQGPLCHHQTQTWLRRMGVWQDNCSLITLGSAEERAQLAQALGPEAVITDGMHSLRSIGKVVPAARLMLCAAPYNEQSWAADPEGVKRGSLLDLSCALAESLGTTPPDASSQPSNPRPN